MGSRPPRQKGQFDPGPRGFIIDNFDILTAGSALKCIFSQSKRHDQKLFCALLSQVPRPQKALGDPEWGIAEFVMRSFTIIFLC